MLIIHSMTQVLQMIFCAINANKVYSIVLKTVIFSKIYHFYKQMNN